jgi:beta-phosphoglucomutase
MLRAIIFDFNGVISDDELIHAEAFRQILAQEDIQVSEKQYLTSFLGRDDRDCLRMAYEQCSRPLSDMQIQALISRKSDLYLQMAENQVHLFPGALSLLEQIWGQCPMAVASGSLRREVEFVLEVFRLHRFFACVVTQEDVRQGKPDPEIFLKALEEINGLGRTSEEILPAQCLVIEDSPAGIKAARAAGMKSLAVANSDPLIRLAGSNWVLPDLRIDFSVLQRWFSNCET